MIERPKMTRTMYQSLKKHIMKERERKKQGLFCLYPTPSSIMMDQHWNIDRTQQNTLCFCLPVIEGAPQSPSFLAFKIVSLPSPA